MPAAVPADVRLLPASTLALLSFAAPVRSELPTSHTSYRNVADHEGQALGFTTAATERYAELDHDHKRLVETEPRSVDYQRGLSVSYDKLGELTVAVGRADCQRDLVLGLQRLGQAQHEHSPDQALGSWREAHEPSARLAAGQPDRPGLATDVGVSLYLVAVAEYDPAHLLSRSGASSKAQGDRPPDNGRRLLATLSEDKRTES